MNFRTNIVYTEELAVQFGALSPKLLAYALRDGRASARLVYEHLLAKYRNLRRTALRDLPADCVMLPDRRILQVRMVTANGVMLNPHRQNGCGRRFNRPEHLEARAKVDGYILVDVTAAPEITYAFVSKQRVPENDAAFSCEDGQSLISLATLPMQP